MDVNSIKASIEAAESVSDIIQILQTANENGVVLDTQYLKDLLSQQSVQVEGKTGITLLYSGGLQTDGNGGTVPLSSDGYQSWQIAESIGTNNGQVITIGQTDAYKLLDSDAFTEALRSSTTDIVEFNRILNGITDENGIRTESGLWDITSQRLAASVVGEVRTVTPFSLSDRVFAQTELPALLLNDKVTSIDGIARTDLLRLVNDMGGIGNADALEAARSAIAAQSWLKALDLEIGTDSTTGKLLVGDSTFFNINAGITGSEMPADVINRTSVSELMGNIHNSQWDALRQGADYLGRIDHLSALEKGVDKLGKLGTAADVLTLVLASRDAHAAYQDGDSAGAATIMAEWSAKFAAGFVGGAELASIAAAFSAPWALTGPVGAGAATIFTVAAGITGALLGETAAEFAIDMGRKYDLILNEASLMMKNLSDAGHMLSDSIASLFTSATVATQPIRRDPLTLDLDNDGLETTGVSTTNPIYFDHDADGVKTATGWVKSDDAFLVLDKNANGVIDSGRELFGDAFIKSNGQLATDGFDALQDLDTNLDGKVDANDAQFANLRLWRDLNQDGVSQSNELFTLSSQNIVAINVGSTDHSQILANGNQLADLGSFVKTDGSSGTLSEVSGNLGDISLVQDTFHSQFADSLDTSTAAALPDIQGAGQVRSLREAASISTTLAGLLTQFASANRADQQALLDPILKAWSDTSIMPTTFGGAYSNHSLTVNIQNVAIGSTTYNAWADKLTILEHFNGRTFNAVPAGTEATTVNLWTTTQDLLQRSYDGLKQSVYKSLLLQTSLKPYWDAINLSVSPNGIDLTYTEMDNLIASKMQSDPENAFADLLALQKYAGDHLNANDWRGLERITDWYGQLQNNATVGTILTEFGYNTITSGDDTVIGTGGADVLNAQEGNDIVYSGAGNDTITDSYGSDTIEGGAGDDVITDQGYGTNVLRGGDGNDTITFGNYSSNTIEGGAGDDLIKINTVTYSNPGPANTLAGGNGNDRIESGGNSDIYLFNRGDGQDVIADFGYAGSNGVAAGSDKLVFGAGIAASDLFVSRVGTSLVLKINDPNNTAATDQITIENWWVSVVDRIEVVQFADGTSLNTAQLTELGNALYGTEGADTLIGFSDNNTIYGLAGNDTITDSYGSDTIEGGAGDDVITDQGYGTNVLRGGDGNDTITFGNYSSNTIEGGAGDDLIKINTVTYSNPGPANTLAGGNGNDRIESGGNSDIYLFNRGDGQDVIADFGYAGSNGVAAGSDKLVFGAGIAASDLFVSRVGTSLVLKINDPNNTAATDQITIENWWVSVVDRIEVVQFADGTSLNTAQLTELGNALYGTEGADTLTGFSDGTTIYGLGGDDTITSASNSSNTIKGGDGNDTITFGSYSSNTIEGGTGNDLIQFSSVSYNSNANYANTFTGGAGNDRIVSRGSADTYLFNRGDGQDVIADSGYAGSNGVAAGSDKLVFGAGIAVSDLFVSRVGTGLVLKINDPNNTAATDQITIENWFAGGIYQIETVTFADGSSLNAAQLSQMVGTAGDDNLIGTSYGDTLVGFDGNDVLNGNAGDDILQGGVGNDTYILGRGYSADTVVENDATAGSTDVVQFLSGIASDQIWLQHVSNNLEVSIIGTADKLVIKDWYLGTANHVEQLKTTDGAKTLLDSNVQNLVNAMASFAPPAAGQSTLPQDYQTALAPVIAANWQ
jgi:Ca2+-binding RTX toxin-like protein